MIDIVPIVELKQEAHKQGQLVLKLFNTRIEAADFTVQNNGFLGQYTDGRYFVVYEVK